MSHRNRIAICRFLDFRFSAALLLCGARILSGAGPQFKDAKILQAGAGPEAVATADFDRDGRADLVVANRNGQIDVLFGNGSGGFSAPQTYGLHTTLAGIAAADFNGDHAADVVVSTTSGSFEILLNDGSGHFSAPVEVGGSSTPASGATAVQAAGATGNQGLAVGDFNGDGKQDVAVIIPLQNKLLVALGNGDGTFRTSTISTSLFEARNLAAVDVNQDGKLDVVVGSGRGIEVHLGSGDGHFAAPLMLPLNKFQLGGFAFGDFTNDGKLDIAVGVATNLSFGIALLAGRGDGTFSAPGKLFPAGPGNPSAVVASDFDHDGNLDLLVSSLSLVAGGDSVDLLLGHGDGSFDGPSLYGVGSNPKEIVLGDFNNDGRTDAVTANDGGTVSVLLGASGGKFVGALEFPTATETAEAMAYGDLNGDKNTDLVVVGSGGYAVLLGNGDGTFGPPTKYRTAPVSAVSVVLANFNNDNNLDMAFIDLGSTLNIYLGNGDGTFTLAESYKVGKESFYLINADLDGDGLQDLVVANRGGDTIDVLYGQGSGKFTAPVAYAVGRSPSSIAVADLNGDGRKDLIVSNLNDQTLSVLLGGTGRKFTSGGEIQSPGIPYFVRAADLNGDGAPDLITTDHFNTVTVFINDGRGGFPTSTSYLLGIARVSFSGFAAKDVNGDGHVDLIVPSSANVLTVLLGDGKGHFGNRLAYQIGNGANDLAVADFNHDGWLDVATLDSGSENVTVLLNTRLK